MACLNEMLYPSIESDLVIVLLSSIMKACLYLRIIFKGVNEETVAAIFPLF